MTKDDKEIVSALRASLVGKVGTERFELWFGPTTRLSLQAHGLLVEVPTQFLQNWMRSNFRKDLEAACHETLGQPLCVEFRVDATLAVADVRPPVAPMSLSSLAASREAQGASPEPAAIETQTRCESSGTSHARPRKFQSLQSFQVGACNRLAHASACMAVERLGQVSPLFLHGPSGVGKTHLLEGIWSAIKRSQPNCSALYLSAEQFTTYFLDGLNRTGLPNFRSKYRRVDLLVLDDVHFFIGKKVTLGEVQHTIDTLLRDGKQLVFAASRPPQEMPELGQELTSRLAGGLVCGLELPDLPTRLGILDRMVAERKLTVPTDVREFIAAQFTSHARELSGALNRLHAVSLATHQPIQRAMAEEALGELIRGGRSVQLADIEAAVCKTLGLDPTSLQSDQKSKSVSYPRMLAMWLARKHTRAALSEIGHYFGGRKHSTVISASKTVNGWMSRSEKVALADHTWPIEDAIRRVEQHLRLA